MIHTLLKDGFAVHPETGIIFMEPYKYFHNLTDMPILLVLFLLGVTGVLFGLIRGIFCHTSRNGFWFTGTGTILTVLSCSCVSAITILLTILHRRFTKLFDLGKQQLQPIHPENHGLRVSSPSRVVAYIAYVWKVMDRKPLTSEEITGNEDVY